MGLLKTTIHQRGEKMMTQGVLPFKYEEEERTGGMTALGGLPIYMEAMHQVGLKKWVEEHVGVRGHQGWKDWQVVASIVLLNIAGGESVEDLRIMANDEGFCRILRRAGMHGLTRRERRAMERRFRKERERDVPSPSSVFRYLEAFHNEEEERKREAGRAFIPESNNALKGLREVHREFMAWVQRYSPEETATLDMDATLVETHKKKAMHCYKSYKAYQPMNVYWAEQGIVAHTEFRDGNVPAGYEQQRILEETLEMLPEGIKKVRVRSDTAGHQNQLLKYCERGRNERYGRIEFAIGCDVTPYFKLSVQKVPVDDWKPICREVNGKLKPTGREWAETYFVPDGLRSSRPSTYRFLATREELSQPSLPGMEEQLELPFPTLSMGTKTYKIFAVVTNIEGDGEQILHWYYERCGKSEEVHGIMKEDLAGGRLPSEKFGANAAWWWMMVLALNLNEFMKRHILGGPWVGRRMKALRFHLIHIPARVIEHSRQLVVKLSGNHPTLPHLLQARQAIAGLACGPSG
jgi:hypothetical protein